MLEIIIILLVIIVIILLVIFPSKSRQMREKAETIERVQEDLREAQRQISEQEDPTDMADRVYEASQRIKKGESIEEILKDRKKTRTRSRDEAEDWRRNPLSVDEAKEEILKRRKRAGEETSEEDLNEILDIWREEGFVVAEDENDKKAED